MDPELFGGLTFDEFVRQSGLTDAESPDRRQHNLPDDPDPHAGHGHNVTGKWGMALSDWVQNNPGAAARLAAETAVDFSLAGAAKALTYDFPRASNEFRKDPGLGTAAGVFLSGLGALPGGATAAKAGAGAIGMGKTALATIPFLARPGREGLDLARRALEPYNPMSVAQQLDRSNHLSTDQMVFMNPKEFLDLAPEFPNNIPQAEKLLNLQDGRMTELIDLPELYLDPAGDLISLDAMRQAKMMEGPEGQALRELLESYPDDGTLQALLQRDFDMEFPLSMVRGRNRSGHEGRHRAVQSMLEGRDLPVMLRTNNGNALQDVLREGLSIREPNWTTDVQKTLVDAPSIYGRLGEQMDMTAALRGDFPSYNSQQHQVMKDLAESQYAQGITRAQRYSHELTPPVMTDPRLSPDGQQTFMDFVEALKGEGGILPRLLGTGG